MRSVLQEVGGHEIHTISPGACPLFSSSYQNKKLKVYVTKSELSFLPSITRVGSSTNRISIVRPEPGQIGWISYLSFVLSFNVSKNRALCALWSPRGLKLVVEEGVLPFFCSKKSSNFTACTWRCDSNVAHVETAKSISLQINFSKWRNAAETVLRLHRTIRGFGGTRFKVVSRQWAVTGEGSPYSSRESEGFPWVNTLKSA